MRPSSSTILAGTRPRQVSQSDVVWPRKRYGADLRTTPSYMAAPADHGRSVQDQAQTDKMEEVERPDQRCIGLEELPGEALQGIPADREIEAVGQPEAVAGGKAPDQQDEHRGHGEGFVELHGMAWDAVAEVDGPGHRCRRAVGEVGQAGEEAAPAADRD